MPESKWAELLQFTSKCKKLTKLEVTHSTIGEAGYWLTQSITLWNNPPLHELSLRNCSIPEQVWPELLQSLSSCKQLSHLDLSGNIIGEAGRYLTQSMGADAPLEHLNLGYSLIPEHVWSGLLQSLSSCKQLSYLDLSGNTIGEAGHYLAQSIRSWGADTPLVHLDLTFCSIPQQVWPELLQSLSTCKQIRNLWFAENTVTGCLSSFLSEPHPGLNLFEQFDIEQTSMNNLDLQHLTHLIKCNKLPRLKGLWLKEDSWTNVEDELEQLKKACCEKSGLDLHLDNKWFKETQIGKEILRKWQQVQYELLFA